MKKFLFIMGVLILVLGAGLIWRSQSRSGKTVSSQASQAQLAAVSQKIDGGEKESEQVSSASLDTLDTNSGDQSAASEYGLIEPIDEFLARITKKYFGIYITPKTSPVQPDRWTGYHTAVDVEYGDILEDVPVRAIADGTVVLSKSAFGYGGVMVIRHTANEKVLVALYGHLDPKSVLAKGEKVKQGQVLGVLGDGGTEETGGTRKHLHFALLKTDTINIWGYVQSAEELSGWYDPREFYTGETSER